MLTSALTDKTNGFLIGISSKTTGIFQQISDSFRRLHFVVHWTFHLSNDLHQRFIRIHNDNVAFLQAYIVIHLTLHDKLIDIKIFYSLSVTHQLYATQTTDFINTTRTVQCMKNSRKSRKRISTRNGNLSHDVYLNSTRVAKR